METDLALDRSGSPLSESEQARLGRMSRFVADLSGYVKLQPTRPQTLAYGLTDSPVGQLAWIVEKFGEWTDSANVPGDAVDRDQLLTNVMLYWLTAAAGSSAQLYVETAELLPTAAIPPDPPPPLTVPLGVAVFPHDIFGAPDRSVGRIARPPVDEPPRPEALEPASGAGWPIR